MLLTAIEEESNQSFNEEDLLDKDGHFVIFAPEDKAEEQTDLLIQNEMSENKVQDQLNPKF